MIAAPSMQRLLWSAVEDAQSQELLTLSDTALMAMLLRQISRRSLLSGEEVCALYAYGSSKISLIRDIADCRDCESLAGRANK